MNNGVMDGPPVRYAPQAWTEDPTGYVASDWHSAVQWPPQNANSLRLYLHGSIFTAAAHSMLSPGGDARSYVYDPRNPVPTLGGRNMLIDAGPRDRCRLWRITG